MNKHRLWRMAGALFIVLLQILMCNRIALWGVATPFVIVYLFLKMPSGVKPHLAMTVAFFVGLLVDLFTNTPGVYALASVTVAFLHNPLLMRIQYRDRGEERYVPSMATLGVWRYALFAFLLTLIFCIVLFCVESFSFFAPAFLAARIVNSTLLTLIVILVVDLLIEKK